MNNNNSFDRFLNFMDQNLEIMHELEIAITELETTVTRDLPGHNGPLNLPPATSISD